MSKILTVSIKDSISEVIEEILNKKEQIGKKISKSEFVEDLIKWGLDKYDIDNEDTPADNNSPKHSVEGGSD